ncbi:MAG: hypothetical protein E6G95_00100 [Alphaproteobacteria bacterium]|nr:MAG: hypothetical protein E6G95_00100 [Alphaproteobacteria bacterium]
MAVHAEIQGRRPGLVQRIALGDAEPRPGEARPHHLRADIDSIGAADRRGMAAAILAARLTGKRLAVGQLRQRPRRFLAGWPAPAAGLGARRDFDPPQRIGRAVDAEQAVFGRRLA